MTSATRNQSTFVGRTGEVDAVAAAADAAASGRPSVVWIEGAAGSGKTTLLRHAMASLPEGFVTVWAQADELATDVDYEVARQLGATTCEGGFAAGQELLAAWDDRQQHGPVAVVVEDLHWADAASSQAVLSAVRRLDHGRLVVIVTSRPDPVEGWDRFRRDDVRCHDLVLSAFDADDVVALAAVGGVELSARQAARLVEHTGGHPLWVHTLLAELTPADLRSSGDLPAPRSLASAVTARLSDVIASGREFASALAVINQRSTLAVVGRVAGLEQPTEAFESLLATGFVTWDPREPGSPVEFVHPLYRQAVYEDLSPTRRRDLHRSAAQVLTPTAVLAHRVAAADGADDGLVDELESLARADRERGANALAARNLMWAAPLCSAADRSERLLIEATLALADAGEWQRATLVRDRIEACEDSPARSLVLGLIDWELGDAVAAERWLRAAVADDDASGPSADAARVWAQLAEIFVTAGRGAEAVDAATRALDLATPGTSAERLAWMHRAVGEALVHGGPAGLAVLHPRLPADPGDVVAHDIDLLATRATLGYYSVRGEATRADLHAILQMARRGTVPVQLARCHFLSAVTLINAGESEDALVHARTALSVANDDQLVWVQSQCHAVLGTLAAYRGEADVADHHAAAAMALAAEHDNVEAVGVAMVAVAAVARSRSDPSDVIAQLAGLAADPPMLAGLYFWPALIHTLIDSDRLDEARDQLARFDAAAADRHINLGSRLAVLRARIAAASGEPEEATAAFEEAVASVDPDEPFLDRALTHQWFGRLLHARGDRRRAIDELRTAREMLTTVGAVPFVAVVDADLATCGLTSATGSAGRSMLDLTDRERDVATLVAHGLTNREVAAELYVSGKAVEYHLRNIYGKLGITSRRELRDPASSSDEGGSAAPVRGTGDEPWFTV